MSQKFDYTYCRLDAGEDPDRYGLRTLWEPNMLSDIAAEVGEDFFHNHDGWESDWPITFVIYHKGMRLGQQTVDMEAIPRFYSVVS